MSLLMDALRKAERAKKEVADTPSGVDAAATEADGPPIAPAQEFALEMQETEANGQPPADAVDIAAAAEASIVPAAPAEPSPEKVDRPEPVSAPVHGKESPKVRGDVPADRQQRPVGASVPPVAASAAGPAGAPPEPANDDGTPPLRPVVLSAESSRQAARTVFAAKKEFQRRSRNRRLLLLLLVSIVLMAGGGGYFLYSWRATMNSSVPMVAGKQPVPFQVGANTEPEPVPAPTEAATAPDGTPGPPSVADADTRPPGGIGTAGAGQAAAPPSPSGVTIPPAAPAPAAGSASPVPAGSGAPAGGQEMAASFSGDSDLSTLLPTSPAGPAKPPAAPIVIRHRMARPQADYLVGAAYDAFRKGELTQARQNYEQVLRTDPKHRGATLGLAAIASQGNEKSLARELYLRLLDRDPGDPLARAGLLVVAPEGDAAQQESELKLLLEQHPAQAPLLFALGNIYASGQRWSEAQQAYFSALQAAKSSASRLAAVPPDYPFNLAVSLEHLGQVKPAVAFYREALQLATEQAAGFDPDALHLRVKELEQGERP